KHRRPAQSLRPPLRPSWPSSPWTKPALTPRPGYPSSRSHVCTTSETTWRRTCTSSL
ncbi:hypothetical protein H0H87_004802, partial [Tephrocybe sp. NHM501043]